MSGIRSETGDGRKCFEFVPPAERPALWRVVAKLARDPRRLAYEHRVTAADGSERWLSRSDVPLLDAAGT